MYHVAERKGWTDEARAYNALVVAWTDLARGAESARATAAGTGQPRTRVGDCTMALTNKERIGRMLDVLAAGLRPVVDEEFTKAYGPTWVSVVAAEKEMSTGSTGSSDPNDPQFLLNAIQFHWKDDARQVTGYRRAELRRRTAGHPEPLGARGRQAIHQ